MVLLLWGIQASVNNKLKRNLQLFGKLWWWLFEGKYSKPRKLNQMLWLSCESRRRHGRGYSSSFPDEVLHNSYHTFSCIPYIEVTLSWNTSTLSIGRPKWRYKRRCKWQGKRQTQPLMLFQICFSSSSIKG